MEICKTSAGGWMTPAGQIGKNRQASLILHPISGLIPPGAADGVRPLHPLLQNHHHRYYNSNYTLLLDVLPGPEVCSQTPSRAERRCPSRASSR